VSLKPGTVTELQLTNAAGEQMRTFADSNGWFTLHDVAPGTYVLTTTNPMFIYPEVRAGRCCTSCQAMSACLHAQKHVQVAAVMQNLLGLDSMAKKLLPSNSVVNAQKVLSCMCS
jgi:hypothetical protein